MAVAHRPPPSESIAKTDTRPAILSGFVVIAFTIGGLAGWAGFAPLASAVIAPGVIKVEGNRKLVQHLEGGVVRAILVQDGTRVEPGTLLARLDDTRARATLGIVQSALDSARILEVRLKAERDGSAMRWPDDLEERRSEHTLAEMIRAQEMVFEARRSSLLGQQSILSQRVAQFDQEIAGLRAQQVALEKQIGFVEEELEGLRDLLSKNITPKTRVLALERDAARLHGTRGERVAEIARTQVSIGVTKLELMQLERAFRENVVKEIRDVQTQIADLEERVTAARTTLGHVDIRAPAAGIVVGLSAHTVGGVVKAGETILEIVPQAEKLIVEAQVQPTDIDNVSVGMEAEVRLTALKQRMASTLTSRVSYVSADRLSDSRTGQPFYLARIELPSVEQLPFAETVQPGMPADVLIKKRERTALEYLMQPMTEAISRAWRED